MALNNILVNVRAITIVGVHIPQGERKNSMAAKHGCRGCGRLQGIEFVNKLASRHACLYAQWRCCGNVNSYSACSHTRLLLLLLVHLKVSLATNLRSARGSSWVPSEIKGRTPFLDLKWCALNSSGNAWGIRNNSWLLVAHEFADLGGIGVDDTNHTNLNLC